MFVQGVCFKMTWAQLMKGFILDGEQKRVQRLQTAINLVAHRDSEKVLNFLQHTIRDHLWKSPCQKGRDRPSTCKQ